MVHGKREYEKLEAACLHTHAETDQLQAGPTVSRAWNRNGTVASCTGWRPVGTAENRDDARGRKVQTRLNLLLDGLLPHGLLEPLGLHLRRLLHFRIEFLSFLRGLLRVPVAGNEVTIGASSPTVAHVRGWVTACLQYIKSTACVKSSSRPSPRGRTTPSIPRLATNAHHHHRRHRHLRQRHELLEIGPASWGNRLTTPRSSSRHWRGSNRKKKTKFRLDPHKPEAGPTHIPIFMGGKFLQ